MQVLSELAVHVLLVWDVGLGDAALDKRNNQFHVHESPNLRVWGRNTGKQRAGEVLRAGVLTEGLTEGTIIGWLVVFLERCEAWFLWRGLCSFWVDIILCAVGELVPWFGFGETRKKEERHSVRTWS